MDERSGSIRLVERPDDAQARRLVATVRREDVEEALRSAAPVDLLLDVERATEGGGRETERVALAWEPQDLEQLLGSASGDELALSFDEDELRRLLDEDVEAHGMREKLAVLSVVAGMAAAGAGAAAGAIPRDDGGASGAAPVAAATAQATASEVSTGLTGVTPQRAAASEVSTGLGSGAAAPEAATAARPATPSEISTGVVGQTPTAPSEISTGIVQEPPVTPAEVTTGIVQHPTATPVSASPSGWSISPSEAALAAGMVLGLTAVGFAARAQHRRPAVS